MVSIERIGSNLRGRVNLLRASLCGKETETMSESGDRHGWTLLPGAAMMALPRSDPSRATFYSVVRNKGSYLAKAN